MNNEWNVVFKLRNVFKKYQDWRYIDPSRNDQWMKRQFSSKYEVCLNSHEIEATSTNEEINNELKVNFLQKYEVC